MPVTTSRSEAAEYPIPVQRIGCKSPTTVLSESQPDVVVVRAGNSEVGGGPQYGRTGKHRIRPMTKHRMAAVDAQFYWMSAKIPNDQFLLYAFGSQPADLYTAIDGVRARARACPDLTMRLDDGCVLTYPTWVPADVQADQVLCYDLAGDTWHSCLDAVVRLADNQLDIRQMPWRLHLFTEVRGIPDSSEIGTVAVMQVAHALADGARASAMAAWLFGRTAPVPTVTPQSRRW